MKDLKSCPFCGETEVRKRKDGNTGLVYIVCFSCGGSGGWKMTQKEAEEAWDKRKNKRP